MHYQPACSSYKSTNSNPHQQSPQSAAHITTASDLSLPSPSLPPAEQLLPFISSSSSQQTSKPQITTTAPTPPRTPLATPSSVRRGSSSLSARGFGEQFTTLSSKITKRSSKLLRHPTKRLVGLSNMLSNQQRAGGSSISVNKAIDNDNTSNNSGTADTISIGKRSLDIRAAIMGKFFVKVSIVF